MVIYGNNLAEKLFGVALSRDYLRFSTPYCELVDDPDFEVDIDLAVTFHAALEGDKAAGRRAVETLVLNSSILDWSTINFYVDKMMVNPVFEREIARINQIFNDPDYPNFENDGGFKEALKEAAQNCLDSPCNVFKETSDSIGRLAQAASTKHGQNTFDLGSLEGIATNIIGGLDQAIFNSIPAAFQQGIVEVTTVAKQAWSNTQAIMMGKGNIEDAATQALEVGSMRSSTNKILSYTPDIKNFFDMDQLGSALLADISTSLGGCFDKFQFAYRYNPYTDNRSTPLGSVIKQVNGVPYTADPGGTWTAAGMSRSAADDCSGPGGGSSGEPGSFDYLDVSDNDEFSENGKYWVSRALTRFNVDPSEGWPRLERSLVDEKVIITDSTDKWINAADADKEAEALKGEEQLPEKDTLKSKDEAKSSDNWLVHKISNEWKHVLEREQMGVKPEPGKKIFDDGAIVNTRVVKETFTIPNGLSKLSYGASLQAAINQNKAFLIVRQTGKCPKVVRIIETRDTNDAIFTLTPGAYKYIYGLTPQGSKNDVLSNKKAVKEAGYTVYNPQVQHADNTEIRVAIGEYDDILKVAVNKDKIECSKIELSDDWRNWLIPGDSIKINGGFESMNPTLLGKLGRIAQRYGSKLYITSGYRGPAYNARVGGAKNSAHTRANAADISTPSRAMQEQLIKLAIAEGIGGIGVYSSSLHFDIESVRAWGPSYRNASLPSWARKLINNQRSS